MILDRLLTHTFVRITCYLLMSALFPIPGMLLAADGGPPEDPVAEARTVQLARLQRHAFASDRADDKAPGLLLGNTRMGGRLAASGLGIPVLWSAELWSNSDQRLPFQGPLLSCAALNGHESVSYRQQLSLTDGLAKTSVRDAKDAGYDAEVFCSMADASLLTIRLTAHGKDHSEWRLAIPATAGTDQPSPTLLTGKSTDDAFSRFAWSLRSDRPLTRAADNRFTLQLAPGEPVTLAFHLLTRGSNEKTGDPPTSAFEVRLAARRESLRIRREGATISLQETN